MSNKPKKRFFANHAKSSAMVVTLGIHVAFILLAFTFVAVKVYTNEDAKFEPKPIVRPKMPIKKLQVPVKRKQKPKPKLRKQITVKARMDRKMPEIKMPEMVGIKGGVSAGAGGLGGASAVGFSMPEINIFGMKSKGEKIFLILDASAPMMADRMGGIAAYTIIKDELIKIVEGLGPTTLFNVVVYEYQYTYMLFPSMVSANSANAESVKAWLDPLNAVSLGMGDKDYGVKTLGKGLDKGLGARNKESFRAGKFDEMHSKDGILQDRWYRPVMLAMQQQADSIFLLTDTWGQQCSSQENNRAEIDAWYKSSAGKKWIEHHKKAKELLKEENKERAKNGQPPKVVPSHAHAMINEYFRGKGLQGPPQPKKYWYTPKDFAGGMVGVREQYRPKEIQTRSGISKKKSKKVDFSFNVIQFISKESQERNTSMEKFKPLTGLLRGNFRTVAGADLVESYVKSGSGGDYDDDSDNDDGDDSYVE